MRQPFISQDMMLQRPTCVLLELHETGQTFGMEEVMHSPVNGRPCRAIRTHRSDAVRSGTLISRRGQWYIMVPIAVLIRQPVAT
jgi:hypothetical protein